MTAIVAPVATSHKCNAAFSPVTAHITQAARHVLRRGNPGNGLVLDPVQYPDVPVASESLS